MITAVSITIPVTIICFIIGLILREAKSIQLSNIILGCIIIFVLSFLLNIIIISLDKKSQILDKEVWSGTVTDVYHKDAWDEYHPPKDYWDDEEYTDSNGKKQTRRVKKTKPAWTEHHPAINTITTSDGGTMSVSKTPDGKVINDNYPKSREELLKYWAIGSPSASVHIYDNYLNASSSLYKHDGINHKDYDLPNYPMNVVDYTTINRLIGSVPEYNTANKNLNEWNSYLNKFVPDPEKQGKMKSYKQVNVIFANLGENSDINWGFALQEKFNNGNKNDFIISFGLDKDYNVKWCYPFSWTEIEILKIKIRDYMLDQISIKDFNYIIDDVCKIIESDFERKQMKDFEYIQIDVSNGGMIILSILNIIIIGVWIYVIFREF